MLGMTPRYDVEQLHDYFVGDFASRNWEGEDEEVLLQSKSRSLIWSVTDLNGVPTPKWEPLNKRYFQAIIERLRSRIGPSGGGRRFLIGVELTFSPPKSYSVATLAGPQVDLALLGLHRQAVTVVLDQIPCLLTTRQAGQQYSLPVEILRFVHPFSRKSDPQLHEHVIFIWDLEEEKATALHTFPLFFHQYTLRCFYHYALVAIVQDAGYVVNPADEGGLAWELAGVDPAAVRRFSKRARAIETAVEGSDDYLFAGVAARLEALRSRRFLPKTDPSISLTQAREGWKKERKGARLVPERRTQQEQFWLKIPELASLFRPSAVSTRWLLLGRGLAACLGQSVSFEEAKDQFFRRVDAAVAAGEILETAGGRLCHPSLFRIEQEVMERVRESLGKGTPLEVEMHSAVPRAVGHAIARPDRIRMVAGVREKFGEIANLNWLHLSEWDAGRVLAFIREYPDDELLVTVAKRPRAGDFLGYLTRFATPPPEEWLVETPVLQIRKKPVRLLEGKISEDVEKIWKWVQGAGEGRSVAVLVPPNYPEDVRVAVNREIATRQILPRSFESDNECIKLERVIPWGEVDTTFDWKKKILFAWRNNPLLRHRSKRFVLEVGEGGLLRTRGVRRTDWRAVDQFREQANSVAILEPYDFRLVSGLQLEVLLRFRIKGLRLEAGELVRVRELRKDGNLALMDGRVVPPDYRAFAPATLVREFHPRAPIPDVVILEAEPGEDVWARLRKIRFGEGLLVLARDLTEVRRCVAREIHGRWVKQRQAWIKRFWEGEKDYGIFPARKSWIINESEPLILSSTEPRPEALVADHSAGSREAGPSAEVVVSTPAGEPTPVEVVEEPVEQPISEEEFVVPEVPDGVDETIEIIIPLEQGSESGAALAPEAIPEQVVKPSAEVVLSPVELTTEAWTAGGPVGKPMEQVKPALAVKDDGMVEITIPLETNAPTEEGAPSEKEAMMAKSFGKKRPLKIAPQMPPPMPPPRESRGSVEDSKDDEAVRKPKAKKALEETPIPPKVPPVKTQAIKRDKPMRKRKEKPGNLDDGEFGDM